MQILGIEQVFEEAGAVITGSHVVYTSGKHGSAYVNKDALYPHTRVTTWLCEKISQHFLQSNVETVIGPAMGGIILSQWAAYHLSCALRREVAGVYADKDGDSFVIKRGYDAFITGKRVLVVEDVLTTGTSVRKVVEAVRSIDGTVVGVGALCNRGGVTSKDVGDVPLLHSLLNIRMDSWEEADCPLCTQGVPINTTVGKGKEFLEKRRKK